MVAEASPHAVRVAPVAGARAEAGVGAHEVSRKRPGRVVVIEVRLRGLEAGARSAEVEFCRSLLASRNLLLTGKLGLARHEGDSLSLGGAGARGGGGRRFGG